MKMNPLMAETTVRRYRCAGCWGVLVALPAEGSLLDVQCGGDCPDNSGFVTKGFAERRQAESIAELHEARHNLKDIIPVPHVDKTGDEILKELGF